MSDPSTMNPTIYQMNEAIRAAGLDPTTMTSSERQESYDRIAAAGYADVRVPLFQITYGDERETLYVEAPTQEEAERYCHKTKGLVYRCVEVANPDFNRSDHVIEQAQPDDVIVIAQLIRRIDATESGEDGSFVISLTGVIVDGVDYGEWTFTVEEVGGELVVAVIDEDGDLVGHSRVDSFGPVPAEVLSIIRGS